MSCVDSLFLLPVQRVSIAGLLFFCFFCLTLNTESRCCHVDHFFVVIDDDLHAARIFSCRHEELILLFVNRMLMAEYLHIYSTTKYLPCRTTNLCPSRNSNSIAKLYLLHHFFRLLAYRSFYPQEPLLSLDVTMTMTPQRRRQPRSVNDDVDMTWTHPRRVYLSTNAHPLPPPCPFSISTASRTSSRQHNYRSKAYCYKVSVQPEGVTKY